MPGSCNHPPIPGVDVMIDAAIVASLIAFNGVFALAELAVVNARRPRLEAMAQTSNAGARRALALAADPGRFLPTVQIGITLISILTGIFSGSALGNHLAAVLEHAGLAKTLAKPLGFGITVAIVTYLTVVVGELVPKRFALREPERIACIVAGPMTLLARVTAPAVALLDASTNLVLRGIGMRSEPQATVSDAEIESVVAEAAGAGVIAPDEGRMIAGVMRLSDRPVRGVMTPRTDVDWIDLATSDAGQRALLFATQHSRLPVGRGSIDNMQGVVQTREILAQMLAGEPLDIARCVRVAPVIPDIAEALDALGMLRDADVPMALVHDEYGHFEGIVTPADVLEAIAGVFRADADTLEPGAVQQRDGSWLIAGWLPVDEMAAHLSLHLPAQREYDTAAGYVLAALRRVPAAGEVLTAGDWQLQVVRPDGQRIQMLSAVSFAASGAPA